MHQPTASLEAINPPRRRFVWAALIGVLCANAGTVLAAILYVLTALHEEPTAQNIGFSVYFALSSQIRILPAGAAAGVLSWILFRRLGAVGGTLVATLLVTGLGGLVGYSFTLRAPHVFPWHAVVDVAAAWGVTALIALSVPAWKGVARR